ncbi:TPA: glycoside hydrolase family 55 protein [Clostridioides difficile]|uniref:glycoside hydrolase family 55 protein n=1 Tax=Clostridioides difficile TaxID=1496 RepID=UPI0003B2A96F|nr:glycoside hydrolase family 55 protein [Clostridioides difficile]MCI4240883.1 glycoside hydrolase family 55 protein [Clostridioides difficile]MDB9599814.1 glycoside hydrolase family 55 protein [Clostridioides difficile]MDN9360825.1 glycoside hydrolase family 55 protein [Clostridioides difficile]MDN9408498.1 glycoside hydrolase family 55 protein [Clostridioides difficile]MDN9508904.1 glycoside hydrolase family 55 protein [Clostridioides difficile]
MEGRTGIKDGRWINVVERGIKNDGSYNVGPALQDIIDEIETDFCVLYFPKGKYLFTSGVKINKEIVLQGDSNSSTGTTQFITRGVENMSIITLTGKKQCIKNINFYSDSCEIQVNEEPPTKGNPKYHYEMIINKNEKNVEMNNVSAILYDNSKDMIKGLGHYENIYISGFSGTGIRIPYYSIVNDITVSSCGLGIDTGIDTIISNSRISKCQNGMRIRTGTSINNVRIEKIQKVGLISSQVKGYEGYGSYKINNITIDQCGYCGFSFDSMKDSYFSGIIRRCGQYYYNTDYDTYLSIKDRVEEAYSLFYGNYFTECNIDLVSDNKDNWDDGLEYKHKVYVFKTLQIPKLTLRCNIDAYDYIVKSVHGGGNLMLKNNFNNYIFIDSSSPEVINGINFNYQKNGNLLMLNNGKLSYKNGKEETAIFRPNYGLIVASTDSECEQIEATYGEKWEKLGSEVIGKETVYYYKHHEPEKTNQIQ